VSHSTIDALLERGNRTSKPRDTGLTIMIDKGQLGLAAIGDFAATAGAHCDYAKIAWGSALITANLEDKLAVYREADILPMLGGTLFEYAYLRNKVPLLLSLARDLRIHVEISDGVIDLPRRDRLMWIERFAKEVEVFSEVGGKIKRQSHDWGQIIAEDLAAGSKKVVIEGREIGPVGQDVRVEFVETVLASANPDQLVFEAFERKQQVWLIKRLGSNVNLGNIPPTDLLTLESFRLGLKEHTLLHTWERSADLSPIVPGGPQADEPEVVTTPRPASRRV
jgi:phosphosulfolactate synthase